MRFCLRSLLLPALLSHLPLPAVAGAAPQAAAPPPAFADTLLDAVDDADPRLPAVNKARLRNKLIVAERAATAAAVGPAARVPLLDFVVLVQRETCSEVFGDVTAGPGAVCMAAAEDDAENEESCLLPAEGEPQVDEEELQLCAEHGGVLAARMPACIDASRELAANFAEQPNLPFEHLMRSFTRVARACWARTLCVL